MNRLQKILLCLIISLFYLQSCSKHKAAPVKDLSKSKSKQYTNKNKNRSYNKDYVKVKKGDTLYSIGFANNVDYKKLAILNNIKAPYKIYPGQKIKLKGRVTVLKAKKTDTVAKTSPVKTKAYQPSKKPQSHVTKPPATKPSVKTQPTQTKPKPIVKSTVKPPVKKPPPKKAVVKKATQPTPASKSQWMWPVNGRLLSSFSASDTSRKGIKIAVSLGQSVLASNNGTVVYSGDGLRGYGELIIIKHSNNLLSAYAHNSTRFVKEGQTVTQGQEIAKSGKGNDGKPLLHFEIRKNGQPVNPIKYLPNK